VRASFQMREFEDRFIQLGLPYRVIGGPRFYERAEIRDAPRLSARHRAAGRRPRLRAHRQRAQSAASATPPFRCCTTTPAGSAFRCPKPPPTSAPPDDMKPKPRGAYANSWPRSSAGAARWRTLPHTELAEIVLDESGYTEMWQKDRSADAAGRLENLKELVRSMQDFENLGGFLEHISLVMDRDNGRGRAGRQHHDGCIPPRAWSSTPCSCPAGRKACSAPAPLDESGRNGLRRNAASPMSALRARAKRAKIYFATNRRIHGMWTTTVPSRFLDELPEANVRGEGALPGGTGGFA